MGLRLREYRHHFFLLLFCLALYLPGISSLPPIDRDEARFAQATSQMLETGDFVQIRFQDEPRNKKPIAIYWLQAASVALTGTSESRVIWPYRIPSLFGAIISVLFTFSLGKRLFGEQTGLLAAALCASTVLLVIEAHLATTDAVLLATVMAAQGALSLYYLREENEKPPGAGAFAAFWIAQAVGILVKGPITPLISLLTIGCLIAVERDWKWLKGLKPLRGLAIVAVIVSPWAIAIALATKGAFFQQAIGGDLLSKVGSGQESHGFPPGYYLLLLPLTLWPASPLIGPALAQAWKSRSLRAIRFCLAWIVPTWVLFELVPTKLPHYILPTYPALCLLIAWTVLAGKEGKVPGLGSKWVRAGVICSSAVILFLGLGALALPWFLEHRFEPIGLFPATASIATAGLFIWKYLNTRYLHAMAIATLGTFLVLAPSLQWVLPNVNTIWLSRTVADAVKERTPGHIQFASAGYHEPSLVFLLGTSTCLTNPSAAAIFLRDHPQGMALIGSAEDDEFQRKVKKLNLQVKLVGSFRGFNYSKGKNMVLGLYGTGTKPDEDAKE